MKKCKARSSLDFGPSRFYIRAFQARESRHSSNFSLTFNCCKKSIKISLLCVLTSIYAPKRLTYNERISSGQKIDKKFRDCPSLKKASSSLKKSSPVVLEPNLTLFTLSLKLGSVRGLQKDAIKVAYRQNMDQSSFENWAQASSSIGGLTYFKPKMRLWLRTRAWLGPSLKIIDDQL